MTGNDADKQIDIIVNGTSHSVSGDEVSFDQVVDIAYPDGGRSPLITYTSPSRDGSDGR